MLLKKVPTYIQVTVALTKTSLAVHVPRVTNNSTQFHAATTRTYTCSAAVVHESWVPDDIEGEAQRMD